MKLETPILGGKSKDYVLRSAGEGLEKVPLCNPGLRGPSTREGEKTGP